MLIPFVAKHSYRSSEICKKGIAPGEKWFTNVSLEGGDYYTYSYECTESDKTPFTKADMKIALNIDGYPNYVVVQNNTTADTEYCECAIVFWKDNGKVVDVEQMEIHDGKIPSGEKVQEKISVPDGCQYYETYIHAYK